jgi:hypothetical protein
MTAAGWGSSKEDNDKKTATRCEWQLQLIERLGKGQEEPGKTPEVLPRWLEGEADHHEDGWGPL